MRTTLYIHVSFSLLLTLTHTSLVLMADEFCHTYCDRTVWNMAKEICIRMALIPLWCSMPRFGKQEQTTVSSGRLHPPEDVRERLISSLKAPEWVKPLCLAYTWSKTGTKAHPLLWCVAEFTGKHSHYIWSKSHTSLALLASLLQHSHAHIEV